MNFCKMQRKPPIRNYSIFLMAFLSANNALSAHGEKMTSRSILKDFYTMTGLLLNKCMSLGSPSPLDCLKQRTLLALDRAISKDVIEICDGIQLVSNRWSNLTDNRFGKDLNYDTLDWRTQVIRKLYKMMQTHDLKINLDAYKPINEARKRKDRDMSGLLMFSMIAMGMIMVPLGFQFLAVLGGKALLLAKMALILASIQGLKKLATSNVNYGFYHTQPGIEYGGYGGHGGSDHGNWHYDRHWPYDGTHVDYYNQQLPLFDQKPDLLHSYPHPRYD